MLARLKINEKWGSYEEVCGLYDTEKDSRMKIRLLSIKYAYEDKKSEDIADLLNLTGVTVRKYMKRWNQRGYAGLHDIPHPEVERKVTDEEMIAIDKAVQKSPRECGIERSNWTAPVLIEYIKKQFGKVVSDGTCYNIFRRLKYTKTRPKKQNKKMDAEAAEKFCEGLEKLVKEKDENTVILYEDEAIFTSEPTICAMWTKEGSQGIVPTSGETRKRNAVFGAVNPENGDLFEHFAETANTDSFKEFMLKVSNALSAGVKAIMPTDNAKYHHFKGKDEWWTGNIPNITLLYLPSHCSFLNAAEHLWKDVRTAVTHNTLFDNFNDMISELKKYIGELKNLPKKLAKLCHFIY
jgi:transposase